MDSLQWWSFHICPPLSGRNCCQFQSFCSPPPWSSTAPAAPSAHSAWLATGGKQIKILFIEWKYFHLPWTYSEARLPRIGHWVSSPHDSGPTSSSPTQWSSSWPPPAWPGWSQPRPPPSRSSPASSSGVQKSTSTRDSEITRWQCFDQNLGIKDSLDGNFHFSLIWLIQTLNISCLLNQSKNNKIKCWISFSMKILYLLS